VKVKAAPLQENLNQEYNVIVKYIKEIKKRKKIYIYIYITVSSWIIYYVCTSAVQCMLCLDIYMKLQIFAFIQKGLCTVHISQPTPAGLLHSAHFPTHSCRSLTFCTFPQPTPAGLLHSAHFPTHSCRSLTFCTFPNPLLQVSYILHISQPTPAGLLYSAHFPIHSAGLLRCFTFPSRLLQVFGTLHVQIFHCRYLLSVCYRPTPAHSRKSLVLFTISNPLLQVSCTRQFAVSTPPGLLHSAHSQSTLAGFLYYAIFLTYSCKSLALCTFPSHSFRPLAP
jgi:hypothetical protein